MLNLTFELKFLNGNKMNESAPAGKILKMLSILRSYPGSQMKISLVSQLRSGLKFDFLNIPRLHEPFRSSQVTVTLFFFTVSEKA